MTGGRGPQRIYLVTGACGGLGAAVTAALASRGAFVIAADADAEALKKVPRSNSVMPVVMDVTDADSVSKARQTIRRSAAALHGIVCAAGIYVGGPLLDVPLADLRRALEVNAVGAAIVITEFLRLLERGGRIVLVSSESTRAALPFTGPYVMSKRALEAYADTLRRELLPLGIDVTTIQPGAIRTPLLASAAASLDGDSARPAYREALRKARRVLEREMRTGMDPARVARVIVRVLERRRPRVRYRVGNDLPRALLAFLPASWIDALVRRFF